MIINPTPAVSLHPNEQYPPNYQQATIIPANNNPYINTDQPILIYNHNYDFPMPVLPAPTNKISKIDI